MTRIFDLFVDWLLRTSYWHFFWLPVVISVVLTEVIVGLMSFLLLGRVDSGYLSTGLVASLIVSTVVCLALFALFDRLRHTEKRVHDLIEVSGDWVWEIDADGRYVKVSENVKKRLGYTPDEIVGRKFFDFLPSNEAARVRAKLSVHAARRQSFSDLDFVILHKDGAARHVEIYVVPILDRDGALSGYWGLSKDITDKKLAERSLHDSETRFRTMFASSRDAIMVAEPPHWRFTLCNPAAVALFKAKDATELLAAAIEQISPALQPDGESSSTKLAAVIETTLREGSRYLEWTHRKFDGECFSASVLVNRINLANSSMLQFTVRDRSRQKNIEEQLRKLSLAVEQSSEGIVITDRNATIEYVNEAFSRMTGYSPHEVIGQNPRILRSARTPKETHMALWEALCQGKPWKGEFTNRRKDGSEYVEFAIVTPIRQADGSITHYVAMKEDITRKKLLGQELDRYRHHLEELVEKRTLEFAEARVRAEAANRAKSAFLANMSHEIRTPMNAIIGLTHLLRRASPTRQQSERLDKIDSAARHLLAIINDILDLSKIEAGRLELERADFHLVAILDHVRALIAEQAKIKGLLVTMDYGNVPLWLNGDSTRLRQALLNYASNAVKFTARGSIALRARLVEENGDDLVVRFEVQDTGIGIAADKLPHLFEAFEQLDASTTRKHGGTGLGLAITRRLALLMGGEAGADSLPQQGSTFWFTASLARGRGIRATPLTAHDTEAALREHSGARLLLAEDNAINREVALDLLHAVGLDVDTANDGREAVQKSRDSAYSLILMDMQMPEMDGVEATRTIRTFPGGADIPILAMTANAFEEDRRACRDAGMNDFIAKPVDPQVLYATLLKWLPAANPKPRSQVLAVEVAEDNESEWRQRLAGVPGLNPALGLNAVLGKMERYRRLLGLFADAHEQDAACLKERFAAGDLHEVKRLAHTLKGSAGTLGAVRVQECAAELVTSVRQNAGEKRIGSCCAALTAELPLLIGGIRALNRNDSPAITSQADQLEDLLTQLEGLLAAGDGVVDKVAQEHREVLCDAFGEYGETLLLWISKHDYNAALTLMRACRPSTSA